MIDEKCLYSLWTCAPTADGGWIWWCDECKATLPEAEYRQILRECGGTWSTMSNATHHYSNPPGDDMKHPKRIEFRKKLHTWVKVRTLYEPPEPF